MTTPHRVWSLPVPARGEPVVDDDAAYFLSREHEVFALALETGEVRWRRATFETGDIFSGASVALAERTLVVGDYNLLAFDRASGALRWRFVPSDGYAPGIYMGEVIEGTVLAGSPSGRIYAVDADSGALRWSTPVGADVPTTVYPPARAGAHVAATFTEFALPTRGGLVVVAADSGRVRWRRHFPDHADGLPGTSASGGPLFLGDVVLASGGDGRIHAFDVETGEIRWAIPRVTPLTPHPISWDRDYRPLAWAGQVLVSGSLTGEILGLDIATRQERWRYTARGLGSSAFRIAASGDVVYVPFFNGMLVALRAADGEELWRIGDYTSGFLWPPAVSRGPTVLAGSGEGVIAVRPPP